MTMFNFQDSQKTPIATKTMEQNKLFSKPFKQTFHITNIKHNIIGIPFNNKYKTIFSIIDSKMNIKSIYKIA